MEEITLTQEAKVSKEADKTQNGGQDVPVGRKRKYKMKHCLKQEEKVAKEDDKVTEEDDKVEQAYEKVEQAYEKVGQEGGEVTQEEDDDDKRQKGGEEAGTGTGTPRRRRPWANLAPSFSM
ncbi:uncharacterized protein LOC144006338 [Festucalex cinctus]